MKYLQFGLMTSEARRSKMLVWGLVAAAIIVILFLLVLWYGTSVGS